jgi:hypothetical protein
MAGPGWPPVKKMAGPGWPPVKKMAGPGWPARCRDQVMRIRFPPTVTDGLHRERCAHGDDDRADEELGRLPCR